MTYHLVGNWQFCFFPGRVSSQGVGFSRTRASGALLGKVCLWRVLGPTWWWAVPFGQRESYPTTATIPAAPVPCRACDHEACVGATAAGSCDELGGRNGRDGPGATTHSLLASSDERSASASGGPHSVIPGVRRVCVCRRLGATGLGPARRRTAGHGLRDFLRQTPPVRRRRLLCADCALSTGAKVVAHLL